jgi:hypothetical protein
MLDDHERVYTSLNGVVARDTAAAEPIQVMADRRSGRARDQAEGLVETGSRLEAS